MSKNHHNNEFCNECGKSVAAGSGSFVNRVVDLNDMETKCEMNKPYPMGEYICEECSTNEQQPPRSFRYLGLTFTPWEMLNKEDLALFQIQNLVENRGDTPSGFNNEEFFRIAKEHHSDMYDVFLLKGQPRIAVNNYLFHYKQK